MMHLKKYVFLILSALTLFSTPVLAEEIVPKQQEEFIIVESVYPFQVEDLEENGYKIVIKTYGLSADENPDSIPKQGFMKKGHQYVFSDLIKKENLNNNTLEHTETIEINTSTQDAGEIISKLEQTKYYEKDGFVGTLYLDISSLRTEVAGKKTDTYTVTKTREYPHLTSNDTSLVPKTISEGGVNYNLSNVVFRTQSTQMVDYEEIPSTYTAVATYTAKASDTKVTGYMSTVNYTGKITKTAIDKVIYTAIFISENPVIELFQDETSEENEITEFVVDENNEPGVKETKIDKKPIIADISKIILPATVILFTSLFVFTVIWLIMKYASLNTIVYNQKGMEFIKVRRLKTDYKSIDKGIFIDLNKIPKKKIYSDTFVIEFSEKATKELAGREIAVAFKDKSIMHVAEKIDFRIYQFEAEFDFEGDYEL